MYLFDTHAILWALADDRRLGSQATALFDDPTLNVLVSVASVWEMAIKSSIGKLIPSIACSLQRPWSMA